MNFDVSTLAFGGALAAIAAFWTQAKNLFSYLSSFVIVQADFDIALTNYVVQYLKQHAYKLPSGQVNYRGIVGETKATGFRTVPYRVLTRNTVFIHKGVPLLLHLGDTAKVMSIRGLCNTDKLLAEMLDYGHKLNTSLNEKESRFHIRPIVGREKGVWAVSSRGPDSSGEVSSTKQDSPMPNPLGGSYMSVDPNIDESFMFPRQELVLPVDDDPLEGLFYDDEIHAHLHDAVTWKKNEKWYRDRSIPWRRGWLVYGPGGTGKSSLGLATAITLKLPLCQFFLNTLSDQEFMRAWDDLPTPCVALFEDFDTVFHGRESQTEHKALTFDCVLNKISGVKTQQGVFLIVTTNHLEHIDPAMGVVTEGQSISTRPGRIDRTIHLGPASDTVRQKIVKHVLSDWPEIHEKIVNDSAGKTVVQTQEICVQFALQKLAAATEARHQPTP